MAKLCFSSMDLNPESFNETPDSTSFVDSTGYEKIGKTIDRMMLAGLNLYQINRNGDYQGDDPDHVDGMPVAPSKYFNEQDVKMRLREIQKRLRKKVNSQITVNDNPDTVVEPDKPVDIVKES